MKDDRCVGTSAHRRPQRDGAVFLDLFIPSH